jgi:hypothetical protein
VLSKAFYGIYCRMLLRIGVIIVSVKVVAKCVHSEMSAKNSIDVDHGNNHKHKHLSQQICSKVIFAGKKF